MRWTIVPSRHFLLFCLPLLPSNLLQWERTKSRPTLWCKLSNLKFRPSNSRSLTSLFSPIISLLNVFNLTLLSYWFRVSVLAVGVALLFWLSYRGKEWKRERARERERERVREIEREREREREREQEKENKSIACTYQSGISGWKPYYCCYCQKNILGLNLGVNGLN